MNNARKAIKSSHNKYRNGIYIVTNDIVKMCTIRKQIKVYFT